MDEEATYLARHPGASAAVEAGQVTSALEYYLRYGRREGHAWPMDDGPARPHPAGAPKPGPCTLPSNCEVAFITRGFAFVSGWVDDRMDPLLGVAAGGGDHASQRSAFGRYRREDAEAHVGASLPFEAGFWSLIAAPWLITGPAPPCALFFASGASVSATPTKSVPLGVHNLLEAFLAFYGRRAVLGNATAHAFRDFTQGLGAMLEGLQSAVRATYAQTSEATYGPITAPKTSLICCLHGIPEFLFLQVARFAHYGSLAGGEFVYVNNSPALEDIVHRDAEIAAYLFGVSIRVVSLNQNTGFSHASTIGIARARGSSVVVINPDVFPMSGASLTALSALEVRHDQLAGAKLFYADGTIMHEGMDLVIDARLSAQAGMRVCSVEHRGKGFSDGASDAPCPLIAASGAFLAGSKGTWEGTGGFDESFIYGSYEDADLCLRLRAQGGSVTYRPALRFSHYEGMGSPHGPAYVAAMTYNRWLFSRRWADRIAAGGDEGSRN